MANSSKFQIGPSLAASTDHQSMLVFHPGFIVSSSGRGNVQGCGGRGWEDGEGRVEQDPISEGGMSQSTRSNHDLSSDQRESLAILDPIRQTGHRTTGTPVA